MDRTVGKTLLGKYNHPQETEHKLLHTQKEGSRCVSKGWMACEVLHTLCRFRRPSNSTGQSSTNLQGPGCGLVTANTKTIRSS